MVIWYLLVLIATLVGFQVCKKGFFPDFLGKEQCNAIKGVFILFVFLAHIIVVVQDCGFIAARRIDTMAYEILGQMGQLIVAMFLFYSGYGVMMSYRTKGEKYLEAYPKSRLLTTLVNFDIAVFCYLVLAWTMGGRPGFSKVALSMIGWDSLGNSNWYIFVILVCYLCFYVVMEMVHTRHFLGTVLVGALLLAAMLFLHAIKPHYWYSTVLVFPAGMFYACYAETFNSLIQKHYGVVLVILTGAFLILHFGHIKAFHGLTYNLKAIVFSFLLVVITMKVRIGNKWLAWCGVSLFPIYIYQRLPMIAIRGLAGDEWVCGNPHVFIAICFLLTVGISLLYNRYLRIKIV